MLTIPDKPAILKRLEDVTRLKAFKLIFNEKFWNIMESVVNRNLCKSKDKRGTKLTTVRELIKFYGIHLNNAFLLCSNFDIY